nr:CAP domain-containing protein [uncultured Agathobaculum sp.]
MKRSIITAAVCAAVAAGAVPFAGAAVTATPTRDMGQTVYVDGNRVYPTGYNIADNNYFKLRDIGTLAGFGVEWNQETQTVEISTERTAPSTAGIKDEAVSGASAKVTDQKITVDGVQVNMTAYQISGNNYVKLRDIGKQVGFGVSYDAATESVRIDTDAPYTEETASVSGSAITKWNSTMTDFNRDMIRCNWDKSKYLTTAKQYAAAITGKADGTVEDVIAALDAMKGAPVEAVSFDNNPVNYFWANELRKALGQEVTSGGENDGAPAVTEEMLRNWELEMVDAVNEERRKVGVPELEIDQNLMGWAQHWAKHLTTEFRHSDIDEERAYAAQQGLSPSDVYSQENITGGSTDLNNVVERHMNNFMTSEGHRNTILDSDWTRVGIGYAVGPTGSLYCVQEFGL